MDRLEYHEEKFVYLPKNEESRDCFVCLYSRIRSIERDVIRLYGGMFSKGYFLHSKIGKLCTGFQ